MRNLIAAYLADQARRARAERAPALTIVYSPVPLGVRFAMNCPLPPKATTQK